MQNHAFQGFSASEIKGAKFWYLHLMCESYNSLILDTGFMCDFLSVDQYKIIDAKIVHSQGMTKRFQMWLPGGGNNKTILICLA